MLLGNYSVRINPGIEDESAYVALENNTRYTIHLRNRSQLRCNVALEIDGKSQGYYRLQRQGTLALDRPAHDQGRFTFYVLGSSEGHAVGLDKHNPYLGLIKATFIPEKEVQRRPLISGQCVEDSSGFKKTDRELYGAGGTGLSGESHQQFQDAEKIILDYSRAVTIHLRLVEKKPVESPRPLTTYSNPVPPPVFE